MSITEEEVILNNGIKMPKLALGTWFMNQKDTTISAVKTAIQVGYRQIDTAQSYDNEQEVGLGIKESGIERGDIFITSKVDAELKDYRSVTDSIDTTLSKLNHDYLDLMLIHNPTPWSKALDVKSQYFDENLAVWQALIDSIKIGKIRAIGVSNFEKEDLDNLINKSGVIPSVNQMVVNIGHVPNDLIKFDQEQGIVTEAYSVVTHGVTLKYPQIQTMVDKYQVTVSQLCIRYVWQMGLPLWRKSTSLNHIKQNTMIDFQISDSDFDYLNSLK
ncbi:aldo/keto reductase family protein [Companilactobacillus kimchiensis]|uniref:Aldo keto reductase n=1 Tax=Companilactobacillus kimchiensis TaxID=993692 RepID=A0A0R2LKK5_9LACO|nr:aldo/keto reductase [Companilactobacillus kimchiensis]KRO00716.1 aldo keto reductase [Companilactobacillus kimchiensis]